MAKNAQYQRMMNWLNGWQCGAAFLEIPAPLVQDADFAKGWKDGRAARSDAKRLAEYLYGEKIGVVRLQGRPPAPGGAEE